ncbi:hypothetical protein ACTXT7_014551 [Hymenolepis weldensis]
MRTKKHRAQIMKGNGHLDLVAILPPLTSGMKLRICPDLANDHMDLRLPHRSTQPADMCHSPE